LRAEGFSCSLDKRKLQFLMKQRERKNFLLYFFFFIICFGGGELYGGPLRNPHRCSSVKSPLRPGCPAVIRKRELPHRYLAKARRTIYSAKSTTSHPSLAMPHPNLATSHNTLTFLHHIPLLATPQPYLASPQPYLARPQPYLAMRQPCLRRTFSLATLPCVAERPTHATTPVCYAAPFTRYLVTAHS
jgi:hypothetical protein